MTAFEMARKKLVALKNLKPAIQSRLSLLLQEIDKLNQTSELDRQLLKILHDTHQLLTKPTQDCVKAYKDMARTVQGYGNPNLRAIGDIMMGLGIIVGIMCAATGVGCVASLCIGGGIFATGGMFSYFSRAKDLSKSMYDLAEEIESDNLTIDSNF